MTFFEHGADRYYYYDVGAGTPVVLLHGLTNTGRAWSPQVPDLIRSGFRVIVPDLLGHGASGPVQRAFTPHAQAQAILALLEFLGLESAVVVGLSLGGMVALELAAMSPVSVDKLVVAGTFGTMATRSRIQMLDDWIAALHQPHGCVKHFKASWAGLVGEAFAETPTGMAFHQAWHAQAAMRDAHNYINWCEGMKRYDVVQNLEAVVAPTLVLAGATDPISPIVEAQDIAGRIRCAVADVIPGCGHIFNVSSAEAFNRRTLNFIQGYDHGQ